MKHVELHANYYRKFVQYNIVELVYCRTDYQISYIFMKPLSEAKFVKLRAMLGLQEATNCGGVSK